VVAAANQIQGDGPSDRIKALVGRYGLPSRAGESLLSLAMLLGMDPLAPTALRDPMIAVDDHIADSLVALELGQTRSASKMADLGAGAGFPGLPLAIALPSVEMALVESSVRKCAFIERALVACSVANARVVNARAESWREGLCAFDLVSARALGSLAVVAEYAAPLLRVGGVLIVWRGRRDPGAEAAGSRACLQLGLKAHEPIRVKPYSEAEHKHLHLMSKTHETPTAFPRRPGMARKRPLGGLPATATSAAGVCDERGRPERGEDAIGSPLPQPT